MTTFDDKLQDLNLLLERDMQEIHVNFDKEAQVAAATTDAYALLKAKKKRSRMVEDALQDHQRRVHELYRDFSPVRIEEYPLWEPIDIEAGSVQDVNWQAWDRLYVTGADGSRFVSEDQGETWNKVGRWQLLVARIKEWVNQKLYERGR